MGHLTVSDVRLFDKDEVDLWFVAGLPGILSRTPYDHREHDAWAELVGRFS